MVAPAMPGDTHGTSILAISVVALLLGPVIHSAARRQRVTMAALDSFVLVAVAGLVALEIVPRAVALAGWPAFVALLAGLAGPAIAEGPLRLAAGGTHRAALALASLGMGLHAFTDGLALASAHLEGSESHGLEVAVIAHQLPVAVAVWWLLSPSGLAIAAAALVMIAAATVAGFLLADASFAALDAAWLGLFQAVVGGLLLHVVGHRSQETDDRPTRIAAVLGGLVGLGLLMALAGEAHGPEDPLARTLMALMALMRASAPVLLLAFAGAGLVSAVMPRLPIGWLGGGGAARQAIRGALAGLPLAARGTVPEYGNLLQRGVPAAAAMALVVATPLLGLDAILLSWPLLGPELTGLRVAAAGLLAWVIGGWIGGKIGGQFGGHERAGSVEEESQGSGPLALLDATAPWIGLGLLTAAIVDPWIDAASLTAIPGPAQVLLMAAIGAPIYVSAAGLTPVVMVLLAKGLSPGAALALLLTGPVALTRMFAALTGAHGRAAAIRLVAVMLALAIGLGLATNAALPGLSRAGDPAFADFAAWALAGLFLLSFVRQGPYAFLARLWRREGDEHEHSHSHEHAHGHGHGHHHGGGV